MEKIKDKQSFICNICQDKGWVFVNEFLGYLRGRKDCKCKKKLKYENR